MNILDQSTIKYFAEINLQPKAAGLIERYLVELRRANEKCNLIGRLQDDHRLCHYHVIDCLLPLEHLPENITSIYDIGTGAGLPGILWAIIYPHISFFLVEKSPKKCDFLTHVVSALHLKNTQVINKRCDVVEGTASMIVSRAMTSTKELLSQTSKLQSPDTIWWLMKALKSSVEEEIKQVDVTKWAIEVKNLQHPTQDVSRNLVCVKGISA